MRKHGIDSFTVAIIETCPVKDLNKEEIYWIKQCGTFSDKSDYNLTPGGDGGATIYKVTREIYDEIRYLLATTDKTPTAIAKEYNLDRSTVENINDGTHPIGILANDSPIRDSTLRQELSHKATQQANSTGAIVAYEDPEHTKIYKEFPSRTAAAQELGGGRSSISRALGMDTKRPNAMGGKARGYYWGFKDH